MRLCHSSKPLLILLVLLSGLGISIFWYHHTKESEAPPLYGEMFRPAFHFSPPQNWMNDPNGLTFINGRYHMYYQYNPYDIVWGNMSWGHASSADLVYWENHPVAIPEYNIPYYGLVDIWSGCNIIDVNNTSGFCEQNGCLLAYYTMFTTHGQAQAFAYSNDGGMTYTQFYGNPIIELGEDAFRDPKVIWYEPDQKWVMINALSNDFKLLLWYSTDLINWLQMSVFGPEGSMTGVWEDPDLFQLTVEGENTTMWILSHSTDVNSVEYYVGNFDGQKFKTTDSKGTDLFIDYGFDFSEAASWNDEPQGRRLMVAWLDEGAYGGQLPEKVWRGSQSLIRELKLRRYPEGLRIVQQPLDAMNVLRANNTHYDNLLLNDSTGNVTLSFSGPQLEIMANFTISNETGNAVTQFGIKVFTGSNQTTVIGYDVPSGLLFVDRSDSGLVNFSPVFFSVCNTSLEPESGTISLRIFVDHSSVEVFANDGKIAMTNLIFPDPTQDEVQVFAVGGNVNLSLDAWNLNSIWPGRENSKLPKKGNVQSVIDQLKQYLSL